MGLPSMNMIFRSVGTAAIKNGERGIVALIIKDKLTAPLTNPLKLTNTTEIPKDLSDENKKQIGLSFIGYVNTPKQVIVYVLPTEAADYTEAQHYLETINWNYLAIPDIEDAQVQNIGTWIKGLRTDKHIDVKAVLPNCRTDHEGVMNFTTKDIKIDEKTTYSAKQYCSRIAGLLAGTPLNISATYAPLPEVLDCEHITIEEANKKIDAGELILINDGRKVKVARAVNSLVTTTTDKGAAFKKIKIIDIMDQMQEDIKATVEDNYIGKVQNDYDHKVLLISAIGGYFDSLELAGLLDKGKNSVFIDIPAQKAFLKGVGVDISTMNEQQIKEANTGDKVFIGAKIKILDAMEDIDFQITI